MSTIHYTSDACVLCGTCAYVCPAGAIDITRTTAHEKSYDFTIWHNSCTLCGNCEYFCPTKAIYLTHDESKVTLQEEKYTSVTQGIVSYTTCAKCAKEMIRIPDAFIRKGYNTITESLTSLFTLCPECRRDHTFAKRVL